MEQQILYQLNAADLERVIRKIHAEERERIRAEIRAQETDRNVTRKEALRLLGVAAGTLWKWGKEGYLTPVYVGSKVYYRKSDLERILGKEVAV